MKVGDVRARLDPFPDHLPPIPPAIVPYVIDDKGDKVPRAPRFDGSRRPAAVLILIYPGPEDEAYIVLTQRAAGGHRHAGQISLPGGAIDASDDSPQSAALREATEEVGLDSQQAGARVVGVLPVFDVRVSGFLVHPVVAFAEREPALTKDDYEVVDIIRAPLAAFLPSAPVETIDEDRDGFHLRYGAYRIDGRVVWGATAMMLGRFGAYLEG